MKKIIINISLLTLSLNSMAQLPKVSSGSIKRYENFASKFVPARNVDVWLPDGYTAKKKYAVLYMHDGKVLFDKVANTMSNGEWGVDETLGKLIADKKIKDCIVVGIWNGEQKRFAEYFPEKIIDSIPEPVKTNILSRQIKEIPQADNYLKFLVTELKPFIDSAYSTKKDVNNTFIMGSSMGGLISAYALCEYPNIFGGAACLSIHSPLIAFELIDKNTDKDVASKFRSYLAVHLPKANSRKIYFDYGDQTGDAFYMPYQKAIDAIMKQKGYDAKHWQTRFFPGENHSEQSWAKRLDIPLLFLLKK